MSRRAKNPKVVAGVPFYNPGEQSARGRHVERCCSYKDVCHFIPRRLTAKVSHCVDLIEIKTISIYAHGDVMQKIDQALRGSAKCL